MDCFQLHERRSGEICNACVLLVKRWKKLPAGSERNWRHVSVVTLVTVMVSSVVAYCVRDLRDSGCLSLWGGI